MHHLTTINLPSVQSKQVERDAMAQAIAAFEAAGGLIEIVQTRTQQDLGRDWRGLGALTLAEKTNANDERDAERIRKMAATGAGISALKYHLKIDARRIHRIAKAYSIEIRSGNRGSVGPGQANIDAAHARGVRNRKKLIIKALPMINAGASLNSMAKALQCSKATLARAFEEHQCAKP